MAPSFRVSVKSSRGQLSSIYPIISLPLIKRFSEREEVVRNDVLSAYLDFLVAINKEEYSSFEPTMKRRRGMNGKHVDSDEDIGIMLQGDVTVIVKTLVNLFGSKMFFYGHSYYLKRYLTRRTDHF